MSKFKLMAFIVAIMMSTNTNQIDKLPLNNNYSAIMSNILNEQGYFNIIRYNLELNLYTITCLIENDIYIYTISPDGIISFSFENNDYNTVLKNNQTSQLVISMIDAAHSINPEFLYGRTNDGLTLELNAHFIAYIWGYELDHSKVVDMGAISGVGYDYNAYKFEDAFEKRDILKLSN